MSGESGRLQANLSGQTIYVLGGSSGIGKAVARLAVRGGARCILAARNVDDLATTRDELALEMVKGSTVESRVCDMTSEEHVGHMFEGVAAGELDHLVITASVVNHGRFADLPLEKAQRTFESKFWGPYRVARAALPYLREGGSITFFSGVLSRRPGPGASALAACNAAVEGLARALAVELGPRVRVNCCSPGMVRSEAYAKMDPAAQEAMFKSTGERLPVGRVGETLEAAQAVLFLMTNGYTTGLVLDVDGGHLIRT